MPREAQPTVDELVPMIHRAQENHAGLHGLVLPWGHGSTLRDHLNPLHMLQDIKHLEDGVLDRRSFVEGYMPYQHPVEIEVRRKDGSLKAIRRSANLRPNIGGTNEGVMLNGGVGTGFAGASREVSGTSSATSAAGPVTVTSNITTSTTNEFQGRRLYHSGNRFGTILSHTNGASSVFTLDSFFDSTLGNSPTYSAATAPAAGFFHIGMPAPWIFMALTNDATTPVTTSTTLTSEITANGLGRATGTVAFTPLSTSQGTTVQQSYTLAHTWTATGAQSCQQAAVFNCVVPVGGSVSTAGQIMGFWATFTGATLATSDSIQVTWTVNF